MTHKLHIVSFDVPYPANYGGVIDVFYKVKALYEQGVKIHLHCFEYGRPPAPELYEFCENVNYYPRKVSKHLLFNKQPYIVISRHSEDLIRQLQKNKWPIILEGLHCTWLLSEQNWPNRKIIVRTHNIEHEYYKHLAKAEKNIFKKYYFLNESSKLEAYQSILLNCSGIAAITEKENKYFTKFNNTVKTIPAFHGHNNLHCKEGLGKYILYHGNLSISENHKAALYLANLLGNKAYQLIIAGSLPRKELKDVCMIYPNIMLIANPVKNEMQKLIENAQINLLITYQNTGLKLKLLYALFNGRHCMVNKKMIIGTGLEKITNVINLEKETELLHKIEDKIQCYFTIDEIKKREIHLAPFFDQTSAQKIMKMLFESP